MQVRTHTRIEKIQVRMQMQRGENISRDTGKLTDKDVGGGPREDAKKNADGYNQGSR